MGRLIDTDELEKEKYTITEWNGDVHRIVYEMSIDKAPTVEAIPKDNIYKAIQEMMKYEHEGFINISLTRLDEILKRCGVCEDEKDN